MLKFILGRASSGKTTTIMDMIKNEACEGNKPVLIVPEQYSFESEKYILEMLGDEKASNVSVLSFTRLYDTIGRIKGGICGKILTDADKFILMNSAISSVKDNLKLWGRCANSSAFSESMISVVDEFKLNSIGSTDLFNTANSFESSKLRDKLLDTAQILEAYNMILGTRFIDPADNLDRLYNMLNECDYFDEKTVFFDGFKGFTGQQKKIIDRIIAKAKNVVISLTIEENYSNQYGLFGNILLIKNQISSMARSKNINVQEIYLGKPVYSSHSLEVFEECMSKGQFLSNEDISDSVCVCEAQTVFDEAEFVARNIKKIIREENAKFSDFVIIARDTGIYEDALTVACKRNGVKCFFDKKIPLSSMPISVFVISAIEYVKKPTIEAVFRFHKSGVGILSVDELAELENYTYIWNIDAKQFQNEWDMNTKGLTDRTDKDFEKKLRRLNDLRKRAIGPLIEFKNSFKGTPKQMATAVMALINSCNFRDSALNLKNEYEENGNEQYRDAIRQSYDLFISLLDSVVYCFPDINVKTDEFYNALNTSISLSTIGTTPQTLDEVVFGSADRIRPSRPKYAFVMGLNQGIFPKTASSTGVFSNTERKALIDLGLEIPDRTISFSIDEEFLVYSNVCCASNKVFLSFSLSQNNNKGSEKSVFLSEIFDNLKVKSLSEPSPLCQDNLPETYDSAFYEYCVRQQNDEVEKKTLFEALKGTEKENLIERINNNLTAKNAKLDKEIASKLYGESLYMSPTNFENYNKCKFMSFCSHGLKAKKLYPAEFNAMQRGTIVHFVLERIIEEYGKDISKLTEEKIVSEIDRFCEEYLDTVKGFDKVKNVRFEFLLSTIKRTLKYVVGRLVLEFAQSEYEPKACELKIGKKDDDDIPAIDIKLDNNKELLLGGVVDRVDTYDEYFRIVDYKTGSKKFKLSDVLYGQNMQMLLYLYAVAKSEKFGKTPAGILYMNAKRVKKGNPADRRMNGLVLDDENSAFAMEKENKGEFVPKFSPNAISDSFASDEEFTKIFKFIERKLKEIGSDLYDGKIEAKPIDGVESPACKYCDFYSVCRINKENIDSVPKLSKEEIIEKIERGEA